MVDFQNVISCASNDYESERGEIGGSRKSFCRVPGAICRATSALSMKTRSCSLEMLVKIPDCLSSVPEESGSAYSSTLRWVLVCIGASFWLRFRISRKDGHCNAITKCLEENCCNSRSSRPVCSLNESPRVSFPNIYSNVMQSTELAESSERCPSHKTPTQIVRALNEICSSLWVCI